MDWLAENTPRIVVQLLSGISVGVLLFLVASGLSLIFGVSRVVNFAHGALYMVGAYLAYTIMRTVPGSGLYYWLALALAPIGVAVVGLLIEVLFLRRIYQAEHIYQLLLTIGLAFVIGDIVRIIWGPENRSVTRPEFLTASLPILGQPFPSYNLVILGLGPLVLLALWWVFYRTRWGMLVRAATWDRDMLGALGVNTPLVFTTVFVFGAWLAGLGGALVAPIQGLAPGMDAAVIILAFVVVVIGGLGSFFGTLVSAILIGVVQGLAVLNPFLRHYDLVLPFALMALVLILRPVGLFGRPES
ncbi:MAG: branched-chain amino acid ABC transporter permease [Dehalococcoidia bacterium]|nr:branched-chain amino acid ABC transporter permease [Dehalococcoidia bacterium]MDW8119594.1 branched-chain amino acid ABC transporter permease [Chloroflexota bacterium]